MTLKDDRIALGGAQAPTRTGGLKKYLMPIRSILPVLFLSVFSALVLAVPPQTQEIYRSMAEAIAIKQAGSWIEPIIAALALSGLAAGLFVAALSLGRGALPLSSLNRLRWPAAIICVLPMCGASAGLWLARVPVAEIAPLHRILAEERARDYKLIFPGINADHLASISNRYASNILEFNYLLIIFAGGLLLIALAVAILCAAAAKHARLQDYRRIPLVRSGLILTGVTALIVLLLAMPATRIVVPVKITAIGVLCLFFLFLTAWVVYLRTLTRATGWPWLATMICAAVVFSGFDLNDNHKVRTDTRTPAPEISRSSGEAQFKDWLTSRGDLGAYDRQRYPIYVIAAQGGGIYSAMHVASFLAAVQDECNNFAHHVFAISGVSGGSVGASLFAGLVQEHGTPLPVQACSRDVDSPRLYFDATSEILSKDFLSPLQAGLMFPDFAQRFLFWPVPAFDRARTLELAFEQAWDEVIARKTFADFRGGQEPINPLREPYVSLWRSTGSVPALFLNTTEVHSGRRRVIAPFMLKDADLEFIPVWNDSPVVSVKPDAVLNQMPLSTAAFLSARFPWISPAGWFEDVSSHGGADRGPEKVRVVDGGYFENSGIVTAVDVVDMIENALRTDPALSTYRDRVEINLITLNSDGFSARDFYGWGELLEPVRTMLSTRSARAPIEATRAERLFGVAGMIVRKRLLRVNLTGAGYPLPLGWRLSPVTSELITAQTGSSEECPASADLNHLSSVHCLRKVLAEQLHGG